MDRGKRISRHQQEILVNFMFNHAAFAAGKFNGPQGKNNSNKLWEELSNLLNAAAGENGVVKDSEKWKKTWQDWRCNAKGKASAIHNTLTETGGGPSENNKELTDLEEIIIAIVGETSATGVDAPESGASDRNPTSSGNKPSTMAQAGSSTSSGNTTFTGKPSGKTSVLSKIGKKAKNILMEDKEPRGKPYTRKEFHRLQEESNIHSENLGYAIHRVADASERQNELLQEGITLLRKLVEE